LGDSKKLKFLVVGRRAGPPVWPRKGLRSRAHAPRGERLPRHSASAGAPPRRDMGPAEERPSAVFLHVGIRLPQREFFSGIPLQYVRVATKIVVLQWIGVDLYLREQVYRNSDAAVATWRRNRRRVEDHDSRARDVVREMTSKGLRTPLRPVPVAACMPTPSGSLSPVATRSGCDRRLESGFREQ
jgi:hypothetical protein